MGIDESSIVGREQELGALAGLVADASAGRGRVALLLGDPGIGKTSLAEATTVLARNAGFAVVWGRCPPDGAPPYWPWSQILSGRMGRPEAQLSGCTAVMWVLQLA